MINLEEITGFDWDDGNGEKNEYSHNVRATECESVFFNRPLLIHDDVSHSSPAESRWYALGQTNARRRLFVAFTIRETNIRVISARDMSRKERAIYSRRILNP